MNTKIVLHAMRSLLPSIVLTLLCLAGLTPGLAQTDSEQKFLVKPYLQFSTQTGMYILWETL